MVGSQFAIDIPAHGARDCRMPRLRHYDGLGTARFVTFSCFEHHPFLDDEVVIIQLLKHVELLRTRHKIKIVAYVIMPDHVHLVLYPPDDVKLGLAIGRMKGRAARAIIPLCEERLVRSTGAPALWQKRCYDHNCRSVDVVWEKIRYCHNNPVQRGLVSRARDWPWSSCRWYEGSRDVPLVMDVMEF